MKIILRESQYKRLLLETDEYGRIGNVITPYILKIFKALIKKGINDEKTIQKYIIDTFDLTFGESKMLTYNFINQILPDNDIDDSLIGAPLKFYGTYKIKVDMPTIIQCRTYIDGFVEVDANSKEEAINKVENGTYIRMYLDDNSMSFRDPDLDFDLPSDADIMEDMTLDHFRDIDWDDEDEIEFRVKLKL